MTTLTDILLPANQTEGTTNIVGKWFRQVGDPVATNDPLLEITTDKVTVEIASPGDGVLVEILKNEGDEVQPGEVLGRIGPAGTGGEPARQAAAPALTRAESAAAVVAPDPVAGAAELTPAVRRLLKQHGLDPSRVTGTGRGGRITVEDVEALLATRQPVAGAGAGAPGTSRRIPHTTMRKSIAAHMVQSVSAAPHVTSVFEADLSAIIAHREAHRADYEARGARLTYTAYFVRASVAALQEVPEVNSRWHDDALELFDDCNIGVGVALPAGGLIVPVLHRAQELDLFETARRLDDLTTRARAGSLEPRDVQGGTFTISNHGVSGSLLAAPIIINQPQSAILGVGKLERRAVVMARGGSEEIVSRPRCYVTLTIDHRVLDGFQANAFLARWVTTVEAWS